MFELNFDQYLKTFQQRQDALRAESKQIRLAQAATQARAAHDQARFRAQLGRVWAWLRRQPNQLQPVPASPGQHYDMGAAAIPIHWIQGSENRSQDFDRAFNPTQDHTAPRWEQIFAHMQTGDALPPVELLRVGDRYYVRDGHHRISVAKALGHDSVNATVTMVGDVTA